MSALGLLIEWPWLALLPAAAFAWAGFRSKRRSAWLAALSWAAYSGYESEIKARVLCSGECNIRVDLLLFWPLLLLLSLVAIHRLIRGRAKDPPAQA